MMQGTSCRLSGKSLTGPRLGLNFCREWVPSSKQSLAHGDGFRSAAEGLFASWLLEVSSCALCWARLQHKPGSC